MIELRNVSKIFRDEAGEQVVAVSDLDLVIPAGHTLCLIGSSGSGKTTTLRMINRLVEPTRGTIAIDGRDVRDGDVIALRRSIGYVIQSGGLFPHMTVAKNVGLLLDLEGRSKADRDARVAELLARVGLPEHGARYPRELSGGQRQRVGLARALALDPSHLLLDEPFGALDPIIRGELQRDLSALWRELGKTVVIVTHDLREAFMLGDSVALMHAGKVVQHGTERELRELPASDFVAQFVAGCDA